MATLKELAYKYTVDGERLTMEEIKRRLPTIHPVTLRRRVYRGLRSWAELGGCPVEGNRLNRKKRIGSITVSETPLANAQADEEDFLFGSEFESAMDGGAPARHLHSLLRDEGQIADCLRYSHRDFSESYE